MSNYSLYDLWQLDPEWPSYYATFIIDSSSHRYNLTLESYEIQKYEINVVKREKGKKWENHRYGIVAVIAAAGKYCFYFGKY